MSFWRDSAAYVSRQLSRLLSYIPERHALSALQSQSHPWQTASARCEDHLRAPVYRFNQSRNVLLSMFNANRQTSGSLEALSKAEKCSTSSSDAVWSRWP